MFNENTQQIWRNNKLSNVLFCYKSHEHNSTEIAVFC